MLWGACAAVVMAAGVYVLLPLFKKEDAPDESLLPETEQERLLDRKAVVYRNLKDLELEYKMGRLSEEDFSQLEAGYRSEAAAVLQKLDGLNVAGKSEAVIDAEIEKAAAARKRKLYGKRTGASQGAPRCPGCDATLIPGKKFCADCGRRI